MNQIFELLSVINQMKANEYTDYIPLVSCVGRIRSPSFETPQLMRRRANSGETTKLLRGGEWSG